MDGFDIASLSNDVFSSFAQIWGEEMPDNAEPLAGCKEASVPSWSSLLGPSTRRYKLRIIRESGEDWDEQFESRGNPIVDRVDCDVDYESWQPLGQLIIGYGCCRRHRCIPRRYG